MAVRMKQVLRPLPPLLFIVPFCLVILLPFLVMGATAMKTMPEIFALPEEFRLLPGEFRWSNFTRLGERIPNIGAYFANSAIIASGATLLALVTALPAAYAISRFRFTGRTVFLNVMLASQMFSPVVIIIGLYKLFAGSSTQWLNNVFIAAGVDSAAGWPGTLTNSLLGLILVNAAFNAPFAVWMLAGYLKSIPEELEQAAWVDGCGRVRAFFRVILPLAAPGVVTAVVFVFIASWNEFVFALTLLASPERRPVVVGLFSLVGMYEVEWPFVMAGALLATVPMVVLFLFLEKHLSTGLTAGAVKA